MMILCYFSSLKQFPLIIVTSQRCSVMLLFYLYPYTLMRRYYSISILPVSSLSLPPTLHVLHFLCSGWIKSVFFIHAGLLPFLLRLLHVGKDSALGRLLRVKHLSCALYSHGVLPAGPTCSSEWSDEGVGLCCIPHLVHHCAVPTAKSAKPALHSNQEAPYSSLLPALLMDLRQTSFSQDENNFSRPLLSLRLQRK